MKTLIRGLRLSDRLAHTEPMASALDPVGDDHLELHHKLSEVSDSELETMIRNGAFSLFHPCCTARMAPLEDGGVVDTCLRVHGTPNLRIVDASVFPSITSGHTVSFLLAVLNILVVESIPLIQTAPVYAIAEKAAGLIKSAVRNDGDAKA